ncbi:GNAT family N-acetyltransferase [Micromonospora sp. DT228]|uniref:GNAT family N-acetyltransferase n=1 Tax=Micromonospora sp. DT228 TaxID=3393443 RepID=UPI003CEB5655
MYGSGSSGTDAGVAELRSPLEGVQQSFLAAMAELREEGRGGPADPTEIGREIRTFGASWSSADGFATYVRWLRDQTREDAPRPEGHVPATNLWWVEDDQYLGRIAVRHRLTPQLREVGGHIGYDVRPSARRRGYATAMLRLALPVARRLGITSALVTCDIQNVASRRVIQRNGGVLEDRRGSKLRFWVPTGCGDAGP